MRALLTKQQYLKGFVFLRSFTVCRVIVSQQQTHRALSAKLFPTGIGFVSTVHPQRIVGGNNCFCTTTFEPSGEECFIFVKNLNVFVVLQQAFSLEESQLDEFFYSANIRINKERVGSKNVKIKEEDIVDIVLSVAATHVTLKRLQVLSINSQNTYRLSLSIWDKLVLPRISVNA